MTQPLHFSSDSVCQDVYRFYEAFSDSTEPLFATTPRLSTPISELSPECRIYVKYAFTQDLRAQSYNRYYIHVVLCDRLANISEQTEWLHYQIPHPKLVPSLLHTIQTASCDGQQLDKGRYFPTIMISEQHQLFLLPTSAVAKITRSHRIGFLNSSVSF